MTKDMQLTISTPTTELWAPAQGIDPKQAGAIVCSFLDTASTSFGRATHYNTRDEQQAAELQAHRSLMGLERDLYSALLVLPGVTDRARQLGLKGLLSTSPNGSGFLTVSQEREILRHLILGLPAPRMLKMVEALRVGSTELGLRPANNNRTRKLILRTLLGSPRLQLWSVKYRTKMLAAFTHCWGNRMTSALGSILAKDGRTWTARERRIVNDRIGRHTSERNCPTVYECVRFVLGLHDRLSLPLFRAFVDAKTDLAKGARLPKEVLEGIRSKYHPTVPKDEVLRLAAKAGSLTRTQKVQVQRQARKAGVEVEFDPTTQDAVRLYVYGFEMGFDADIMAALDSKARKAAAVFPAHYAKVGLIVDASASMYGDKTQALRPMAATLALRDMLQHVGDEHATVFVGGEQVQDGIVRPQGDTALADGLVEVLSVNPQPDAVFVLSDGYENAPAGRFAEVLGYVREMGIETPVYHLSPVFAAEATGVRELDPGNVPTLPVRDPAGLGTTFLRGLIENEPVRGINALLHAALTVGPVKGLIEG